MTQVMKWFYLVDVAVWLGSLVFFSFVVAPTVHRTLKTEDAATLIRRIFPKYYMVGLVCAGIGIVLVGLLVAERAFAKWPGVLSYPLLAPMRSPSEKQFPISLVMRAVMLLVLFVTSRKRKE